MTPRIFISSTFYDFRFIREDLANFVRQYGFEPILFEQGDVGYIHGQKLDESCYKEMCNADMCILIVGGRYGSAASGEEEFKKYMSVTRKEFNTAIEEKIPVYAFVEARVLAEYAVYNKNRELEEINAIKFATVENVNIFDFIDAIYELKVISVTEFSEAYDIKNFLRKQWADMFKEYLLTLRNQEQSIKVLDAVNHLDKLVRQMNVMVQKTGEKVIGAQSDELKNILEEQNIEVVVNTIANSVEFIMAKKNYSEVQQILSKFVERVAQGCLENVLIKLLSNEEADVLEVYTFFEDGVSDMCIGNIKETMGVELASYKEHLGNIDFRKRVVERLLLENNLIKMKIMVKF